MSWNNNKPSKNNSIVGVLIDTMDVLCLVARLLVHPLIRQGLLACRTPDPIFGWPRDVSLVGGSTRL